MLKTYSVESGPDNSHLFDVKHFDRLKDAKAYIESLPPCPTGEPRPYRLNRMKYETRKTHYYDRSETLEERCM